MKIGKRFFSLIFLCITSLTAQTWNQLPNFTRANLRDLEILSLETTGGQFETELVPITPRQKYEITVRLGGDQEPEQSRGHLIIRTNQEGEEEIKIPLSVAVKE